MLLTFVARDFFVATWEVDPEAVARALPDGLEPALSDRGGGLVAVAAYRNVSVRLDGRRTPSFSQVDVRAAVLRDGAAGVLFLSLRVTAGGLGGVLFGAPYRPSSITVREGLVRSRGLGLDFRYTPGAPAETAPRVVGPGTETLGYYVAAGVRRIELQHDAFDWRHADLTADVRAEPVLALGFDVGGPPRVAYAASTAFRVQLPAEKLS